MFYSRKEHEKCEFELHEVYAVDILVSTGEGKVSRLLVPYLKSFDVDPLHVNTKDL